MFALFGRCIYTPLNTSPLELIWIAYDMVFLYTSYAQHTIIISNALQGIYTYRY